MRKVVVVFLAMFVLVGCGNDDGASATPQAAEGKEMLPVTLIAATQPAGAVDVAAAKKSAKEGATIVIRGKIGGTEKPLAENRAIMTILDVGVQTCDAMPGDACKTPWDACCEPVEVRTAKSASVQVVGGDGKPLRATLSGVSGIAPLRIVTVTGTARVTPGTDTLVVDAKEIHVEPAGSGSAGIGK